MVPRACLETRQGGQRSANLQKPLVMRRSARPGRTSKSTRQGTSFLDCFVFFFLGGGPVCFFWYRRKGSFSALGRPGAQQLREHTWTESEESPPCCPEAYLYLHQCGQGPKKASNWFFFGPATRPRSGQGFQWPLCSPDRDALGPKC